MGIRVLIVDDHTLVREGLAAILAHEPDFEVVGTVGRGEEALDRVRDGPPDVVLMDVNMPGMGGIEATRRLVAAQPALAVIAVSMHTEPTLPMQLLKAGARGYLTKDSTPAEIMEAVRRVNAGGRYLSPALAQTMAFASTREQATSNPFDALSAREMEIVLMTIEGSAQQVIADRLCLSPKTVSTYRGRAFEKLGVSNDVQLLRLAHLNGLAGS